MAYQPVCDCAERRCGPSGFECHANHHETGQENSSSRQHRPVSSVGVGRVAQPIEKPCDRCKRRKTKPKIVSASGAMAMSCVRCMGAILVASMFAASSKQVYDEALREEAKAPSDRARIFWVGVSRSARARTIDSGLQGASLAEIPSSPNVCSGCPAPVLRRSFPRRRSGSRRRLAPLALAVVADTDRPP